MNDLYMILLLGAIYMMFYGFLVWCGRVVRNSGGERL